jgi:hypothetical protein
MHCAVSSTLYSTEYFPSAGHGSRFSYRLSPEPPQQDMLRAKLQAELGAAFPARPSHPTRETGTAPPGIHCRCIRGGRGRRGRRRRGREIFIDDKVKVQRWFLLPQNNLTSIKGNKLCSKPNSMTLIILLCCQNHKNSVCKNTRKCMFQLNLLTLYV